MNKCNLKYSTLIAVLLIFNILPLASTHAATPHAEDGNAIHWSYTGSAGPAKWGGISREYALCKSGKRQSPVNIKYGEPAELYPLRFQYQSVPLQVVNNGHTLQTNYNSINEEKAVSIGGKPYPVYTKPAYNSALMLADVPYKLLQFHFHTPSEHASQTIHELEQHSEAISSVMDVITGIAEQTNLLALNAAIEVARADVKHASESGSAFSTIADAVTRINGMSAEIASAAEEQGAVSEEINKNIVQINDMASQTASGAEETSVASKELTCMATELQGIISHFTV